jgi:hypothetical protein
VLCRAVIRFRICSGSCSITSGLACESPWLVQLTRPRANRLGWHGASAVRGRGSARQIEPVGRVISLGVSTATWRRPTKSQTAVPLGVTAVPANTHPLGHRSGHGGLAVFAVAAYVEPEVTRQGEQALHEMALDFDGMPTLSSMPGPELTPQMASARTARDRRPTRVPASPISVGWIPSWLLTAAAVRSLSFPNSRNVARVRTGIVCGLVDSAGER